MVGAGVTAMLTDLEVVVLLIIVMAPPHPMAMRDHATASLGTTCGQLRILNLPGLSDWECTVALSITVRLRC
ncbi:hypothetical protein MNBD_ACTINO01-1971 [hydrothermal vent metagenome]|uniref:Uncharacterized protein n=1 Tax=hydrothermal vent metagenome TaxID=652676 RepID=A0A3B0SV52_9ZZZZ